MSYVPLVPYYITVINTKLNIEEVRAILLTNIDPEFKWKSSMLYWGTVEKHGFSASRYINGRNTYLPLVKGTFEPCSDGVTIKLSITLQPGVIILLIALFLLVLLSFVHIGKLALLSFVVFAFIFHCIMFLWGFLPERRKSEQWLKTILKAND